MADDEPLTKKIGRTDSEPTVRDLMESFEHGQIDFDQLKSLLAVHPFSDISWHGPTETHLHDMEDPHANDFEWVEQAEFLGLLTIDQIEEIIAAMKATHDNGKS